MESTSNHKLVADSNFAVKLLLLALTIHQSAITISFYVVNSFHLRLNLTPHPTKSPSQIVQTQQAYSHNAQTKINPNYFLKVAKNMLYLKLPPNREVDPPIWGIHQPKKQFFRLVDL